MTEKYIKLDEALKLVEAHISRFQPYYFNTEIEVIHPTEFVTALKKLPTIRILNCKECARTHFCNYSFEWGDRILEDCPLYRPREPEKEEPEE